MSEGTQLETKTKGFFTPKEAPPPLIKSPEKHGQGKHLPTGILELDTYLEGGLYPGITILYGLEATGKSALCAKLVTDQAKQDHPVLYLADDKVWKHRIEKNLADEKDRRNVLMVGWGSKKPNGEFAPLTFETLVSITEDWCKHLDKGEKKLIVFDSPDFLLTDLQTSFSGFAEMDRKTVLAAFTNKLFNLSVENNAFVVVTTQARVGVGPVDNKAMGKYFSSVASNILRINDSQLFDKYSTKGVRPYKNRGLFSPMANREFYPTYIKGLPYDADSRIIDASSSMDPIGIMLKLRQEKPRLSGSDFEGIQFPVFFNE